MPGLVAAAGRPDRHRERTRASALADVTASPAARVLAPAAENFLGMPAQTFVPRFLHVVSGRVEVKHARRSIRGASRGPKRKSNGRIYFRFWNPAREDFFITAKNLP